MKEVTPIGSLKAELRFSLHLERLADSIDVDTPLKLIAIGFLIRNRRLAEAILRLGTNHAYEGRMLLRTMVEIMINHSWIRLKWTKSRALRYVAYQPLELLRVSHHGKDLVSTAEILTIQRNLERERAKVRHLFQFKDKKGKLRWARSWATVESLDGRLSEVLAYRRKRKPYLFLYALYAWTSSSIHCGPGSLNEVLDWHGTRISAKNHPEGNLHAQFAGAAGLLHYSIHAAIDDLGLKEHVSDELTNLDRAMKRLRDKGAMTLQAAQPGVVADLSRLQTG
jgi:hypothetical protein